jgi:dihydroneopterin aldolase
MSTYAYREVLNQAQHLTTEEQLQLIEELAALIRRQGVMRSKKHSIMELKGLGKEIWEGVDVEKYIDEERNSWDG